MLASHSVALQDIGVGYSLMKFSSLLLLIYRPVGICSAKHPGEIITIISNIICNTVPNSTYVDTFRRDTGLVKGRKNKETHE